MTNYGDVRAQERHGVETRVRKMVSFALRGAVIKKVVSRKSWPQVNVTRRCGHVS